MDEIELCLSDYELEVKEVDIASDPELLRDYGTSIPVLFSPKKSHRLFWPFDRLQVMDFLER